MKLQSIRLSNFQSFGDIPTELTLENITYLIGPNGSGKTAALQALCRMFSFDPSLKRIQKSDFHVPHDENDEQIERKLWIETDFSFPELLEPDANSTVAPHFGHMRLDEPEGIPRVRYRLSATLGIDGDIEEKFEYILEVDEHGEPTNPQTVPRAERNHIQVHYLPARRDPSEHITYGTNALLGRLLRAINWENEREEVRGFTDKISDSLANNPSVNNFSNSLKSIWTSVHKGSYFSDPKITFVASEIEALLRHLSISFSPGHDENLVDFSRLSDGQKSMLYLSLVLSSQAIGRSVLSGEDKTFDPEKLRPPVFTLIALEEPENSLSPHYLGRIVKALSGMTEHEDAQALIATHAPSMLKRVAPETIRYLRLTENRKSKITQIQLPAKTDEAHKFVREAIQAFPEIYFSRLVVLGEGDSEEIVLPRLLSAKGAPIDESAVTIAPLGGRHVNHFWRLLAGLQIPFITLLDLDVARYQGGWGRIKYVNDQHQKYDVSKVLPVIFKLASWNSDVTPVRTHHFYEDGTKDIFCELEKHGVFFSSPLDLDFSMISSYSQEYNVQRETPTESTINAVLGKSHHSSDQYNQAEQELFLTYHRLFKLGSKPAAHIEAMAELSDAELLANMPASFSRLADAVIAKLESLPE
jgi:putative ATP-dependent endonuclease of OLD family